MSKGQLWETKPLEFWPKAKELRQGWQNSIESKNKVVGQGNTNYHADWAACFPAVTVVEDNPAGAMMASKNGPFARKCRLASEIRGWGREVCGYQNNCWGAQFLGYQDDGSPFPKRQFVVPIPCLCDQHAKRGQQVRDFEAVPQWMIDMSVYLGPRDAAREEAMIEHRAWCQLRQINDIERIFGQAFDDEKLYEMIKASNQIEKYARDISVLMAATKPTPLSVKDLYSVYTIGGLTKVDPEETVRFWKLVRDEIAWRAENQIAAVGNERFRWIETHPPSWHFLKYYRYMENYGAVCLGSQYVHRITTGCLERKPDGSVDRREMLSYPEDTPLITREDGVRFFLTPDARDPHHHKMDEYIRPYALNEFADVFQADGAMLALWRCGVGCTFTRKEQAMRLRKAGISVLHVEGSQPGDRTDLDEKRFLEQLDSWMDSVGLEKIED
jgi:benzoyl-CoA reductase subunit B